MRLINCETLRLEEYFNFAPHYAILSHTWGSEEISFAEFSSASANVTPSRFKEIETKEGYKKIKFICKQALEDGLRYAWVDTCCIDKSSSSELTEAINSMFKWYKFSDICYVYLSDVRLENLADTFPQSRWSRRGWTLQELLAPSRVVFYDANETRLAEKSQIVEPLSKITGIDESALKGFDEDAGGLSAYCIARRMSWAANRETTRREDIAYSLLGLFQVNMPLLYGEGHRAFTRLQEEIIKQSDDESLFAWGLDTANEDPAASSERLPEQLSLSVGSAISVSCRILAESPKDFNNCKKLQHGGKRVFPFRMTSSGLEMELYLVPIPTPTRCAPVMKPGEVSNWLGLLNCRTEGSNSELIGILLGGSRSKTVGHYRREQIGHRDFNFDSNMFHQALLVGERLAVGGVRTKITIEHGLSESETARWAFIEVRKYFINDGPGLKEFGYHIKNASRLIKETYPGLEDVNWNSQTQVLTAADPVMDDYFGFEFESPKFPTFTLIVYKTRGIIRVGGGFSPEKMQEFINILNSDPYVGDSKGVFSDMAICSSDGTEFRFWVDTVEKELCHWEVFEVDVDIMIVGKEKSLEPKESADNGDGMIDDSIDNDDDTTHS